MNLVVPRGEKLLVFPHEMLCDALVRQHLPHRLKKESQCAKSLTPCYLFETKSAVAIRHEEFAFYFIQNEIQLLSCRYVYFPLSIDEFTCLSQRKWPRRI